jgi:hypothetical protein
LVIDGKAKRKENTRKTRSRWADNIKLDLEEIGLGSAQLHRVLVLISSKIGMLAFHATQFHILTDHHTYPISLE